MKKGYVKKYIGEYADLLNQIEIDVEVKIIIERKEQEGVPLKEVCRLLKRSSVEINKLLGRRYKIK